MQKKPEPPPKTIGQLMRQSMTIREYGKYLATQRPR